MAAADPHDLWRYFDSKTGWIGPVTLQKLDELYEAFEIRNSTPVVSEYILRQRGRRRKREFQLLSEQALHRVDTRFSTKQQKLVGMRV